MFFNKEMFAREHRSTLMLFITVMGGLFNFLPMATTSNLENSTVSEAIRNGPLFRIGIVALISLATPFFMNHVADSVIFFTAKKTTQNAKAVMPSNNQILSLYEKFFFFLGILIVPFMSCFTEWNRAMLLIACTACAQQHMVFGVVLTSLNRFNDHYFPTPIMHFLLLISTVGSVLRSFYINACATMSYTECVTLPGWMFSKYEAVFGYIVLTLLILVWMSSVVVIRMYDEKVHAQYFRWPSWFSLVGITTQNTAHVEIPTTKKKPSTPTPTDDFFLFTRAIYGSAIIVWGIFVVTNNGNFGNIGYTFSHSGDKALLLNCVPYIIFELAFLFFALRLVKNETVSALLAVIDAKKMYVRYISHELRTPLSAANSGLQMLYAELSASASTNAIDEERLDTVTDVCSAINTTVSILDDLLTFEKMESGKKSPSPNCSNPPALTPSDSL